MKTVFAFLRHLAQTDGSGERPVMPIFCPSKYTGPAGTGPAAAGRGEEIRRLPTPPREQSAASKAANSVPPVDFAPWERFAAGPSAGGLRLAGERAPRGTAVCGD